MDRLLLESKQDIPYPPARITIHQPSCAEISMVTQDAFFSGANFLNFSKQNLRNSDKIKQSDLTDFEIIMTIINDKSNPVARQNKIQSQMVLALIFPDYSLQFSKDCIILSKEKQICTLNKENYKGFQQILAQMLCLNYIFQATTNYKPAGPKAQKIADKLNGMHNKINKEKGGEGIQFLDRYISILSVGLHMSKLELSKHSVYQIIDYMKRFELQVKFDIIIREKMAGATDLQEPENWMKDLYSVKENPNNIQL